VSNLSGRSLLHRREFLGFATISAGVRRRIADPIKNVVLVHRKL
jgi:hypothetical protein